MRHPCILLITLFWVSILSASTDRTPSVTPTGIFINHDGEEEELETGGSYDAPLTVTFCANPIDTVGYTLYYEWRIIKTDGGEETTLAIRNDEITEYTFRDGGSDVTYRIGLSITFRNRATNEEGSIEQDYSDMLQFTLSGSSLTIYNAFSPNNDGVNDVFRVKTQSLLSFQMAIFNRWGQCVASGTEQTLDVEYQDNYTYYICWDGTYHGQIVENGVYYIVINAVGSDGIKYSQRSDINVFTRILEKETK